MLHKYKSINVRLPEAKSYGIKVCFSSDFSDFNLSLRTLKNWICQQNYPFVFQKQHLETSLVPKVTVTRQRGFQNFPVVDIHTCV